MAGEARDSPVVSRLFLPIVPLGGRREDLDEYHWIRSRVVVLRISLQSTADDGHVGVSCQAGLEHANAQIRGEDAESVAAGWSHAGPRYSGVRGVAPTSTEIFSAPSAFFSPITLGAGSRTSTLGCAPSRRIE